MRSAKELATALLLEATRVPDPKLADLLATASMAIEKMTKYIIEGQEDRPKSLKDYRASNRQMIAEINGFLHQTAITEPLDFIESIDAVADHERLRRIRVSLFSGPLPKDVG